MKKFFCLLLCLSMAFSVFLMQTTFASDAATQTEYVPKGLIYALGIAEESDNLTAGVSRGEFAALVASFLDYDVSNSETVQLFRDVDGKNANIRAINMMQRLGYMSGDGDGYFRPNDIITYQEVITVMVKTLGYGNILYQPVQYAFSYLAKAKELDIDLEKTGNGVTRGEVYFILERALEAPYRPVEGVSGNNVILGEETTVLKKIYNVYDRVGTVTQNNQTALYDVSSGSRRDAVEIDNEPFWTEDISIGEHLGERVKFYYKDEEQIGTLIFYTVDGRNDILIVSADDVKGYSDGKLEYFDENGRIEHVDISQRANVIYNGVYYAKGYDLTAADFKFSAGEVKLISDGSSEYETVCISAYQFAIFEYISSSEELYVKKSTDAYALREYTTVTVIKDGVEIAATDLEEWDVLNILEDKQEKHLTIYAVQNTVEGKPEAISDEGNGKKLTIDGVTYEMNEQFDAMSEREVKLGRNDVFLLDRFGKIAAVREQSSNGVGKYGVVLDIAESGTLENKLQIKFLNSKNRVKIYDITSSTLLNGKTYSNLSEARWLLDDVDSVKGKPLRFETNKEGKLTELYIECGSGYENELKKSCTNVRKRYKTAQKFFGGAEIAVRDNTALFVVATSITSDDDCSCVGLSHLSNDDYYYISAYNLNDYNIADLIIIHEDNSSGVQVVNDSSAFVSEGLRTGINADGERIYKLYGMYGGKRSDGEYWFIPSEAKFSIDNFKKGNIFQIKTDNKGKVVAVQLLLNWDPENLNFQYSSSSILGKVFGKVVRASDDNFMLNVSNNETEDLRILMAKGTIYVYDVENDKVRLGNARDVAPGRILFIRDRYQDAKDIIIYVD